MKDRKHIKRITACVIGLLAALLTATSVFADSPSFSYQAILPENQINKNLTYFDLRVSPGMEQTIQVEVMNNEDKPILAQVEVNTAATAQNGVLLYTAPVEPDESMQIAVADIATVREAEKRIEPNETVLFDIDIKMPDQEVDGILLGGVVLTAVYAEEVQPDSSATESPMAIENRVRYVSGLKITMNDNPVEPDFKFVKAEAGLTNYRPSVQVAIQNPVPMVAKGINMNIDIAKKGSAEVLYNTNYPDVDMAPQSSGIFDVFLGDDKVEPGTYTAHVTMDWEGKNWTWDEEFVIEGESAQQINQESLVDPKQETAQGLPIWVYIIVGVAAVLVIVLIVVLIVVISNKKKEQRRLAREAHRKSNYYRRRE